MSTGYSGTPLPQKLGVKPGHTFLLLDPPEGFALDLPPGVQLGRARHPNDVILAFFTERRDLVRQIPKLRTLMEPAGGLWIAWPKKASGVETDITEDVIREVAFDAQPELVDNKVCAIDETWSGLRLVVRVKAR